MKLPTVLPDAVLLRMSAADRASLGKAGLTRADCEALCEAKNERELQKQIVSYLRLQGIEVNVSRMDKRTTHKKGWPDITFCVQGITRINSIPESWIFACAWEIKFGNGKLSPEQEKLASVLTTPPNGWRFRIIRSLEEAIRELRKLGLTGNRD